MSDNATLPAAGDSVRAIDKAGVKTQVAAIDIGGGGAESLLSASNKMPVVASELQSLLTTVAGSVQVLDAVADGAGSATMLAGIRRDAETSPVSATGDVHPLLFNDGGRLKVSVTPADIANTSGNITSNGGTVSLQIKRLSNLSISMVATSLVGHNATFEASNNSTNGADGNWYAVQVVRSNANTVETATGVLAATPVYMWQVNVSDYGYFRVRATAHTSGTAAYTLNPSAYVSEPIPAVQVTATQPVSGSLTSAGTTTATPATPTASIVTSAATTNGTVVKASAGTLYGITASNTGAVAAFLKFHNSATVTAGTTAVALTIPIPAGSTVSVNFGALGMRYGTGICLSITNLAADTDTTAIAVNQVKVNTSYI